MSANVIITNDYFLDLGKGNVPFHSVVPAFGENPVITTGFETIWDGGGVYVPPTQARFHNIKSSLAADAGTLVSSGTATGGGINSLVDSAGTFETDLVAVEDLILNDEKVEIGEVSAINSEGDITISRSMRNPETGLDGLGFESGNAYRIARDASTGVSVLHLIGLSPSFLDQDEFVLLNGVSNVVTAKSYPRQHRARVFSTDAANAVGTITSTTIGEVAETVSLQVIDGNNQALMAVLTIPGDSFGLVARWWGSMSKKQSATSTFKLRIGQLDHIGYIKQVRSIQSAGASAFDYDFKGGFILPGGSDIWMEADADAASVGVSGGFDVMMVKVA